MRLSIVFKAEGVGGYTYEYAPALFRNGDQAAVKSLVERQHEVSYERFLELYQETLEKAFLQTVPVERENEVEEVPAKGS